ncbi:MAG: hypothetical protein NEHIOOID_01267 [Holosporales bacterium]
MNKIVPLTAYCICAILQAASPENIPTESSCFSLKYQHSSPQYTFSTNAPSCSSPQYTFSTDALNPFPKSVANAHKEKYRLHAEIVYLPIKGNPLSHEAIVVLPLKKMPSP